MSQIAEPVIAGLEVVEHFGEAREVLARLMAAPVVRVRGSGLLHRSGSGFRRVMRDVSDSCDYMCLTGGDVAGSSLREDFRGEGLAHLDAPRWIHCGSVESWSSSGAPSFSVRGW